MTDNFFKIDPECHLIGDMEPLNYYPGVQMWWRAIENIKRPLLTGPPFLCWLPISTAWRKGK